MKLPEDVVIPQDNLLRYSLLPRDENDKSRVLVLAGYTLANWEVLEHDLRQLVTRQEVSSVEISLFGTKYEVRGRLTGPNGNILHVVTVWIKLKTTGETRFVTLFPDREVTE